MLFQIGSVPYTNCQIPPLTTFTANLKQQTNSSSNHVTLPTKRPLTPLFHSGPGSSSGKTLSYGLDDPGLILGVGGVEIFLRSFVSRLVLGSTRPPIK